MVMGEVPVGRDLGQRRGLRVPDLIVAFGVDRRRIIADRGYSIEHWGKPPDLVLEIASETTAENDVTGKRDGSVGTTRRRVVTCGRLMKRRKNGWPPCVSRTRHRSWCGNWKPRSGGCRVKQF